MNTQTTSESPKKGPTHNIFQVEDRGEGKQTFWREVGVAYTNTDGSLNLVFAVIPMIGKHRLQVRLRGEKKDGNNGSTMPSQSGRSLDDDGSDIPF